ncbi:MAG: pyruvate carboxylase [Caulobacteraceae bacterium]|nr:pyruvate carboxylase [Caulobacteraceae bacterium]
MAKELEAAGSSVLAIKDMAGLLRAPAAGVLVRALREVTDLPLHLHTHDTCGIQGATILAAIEAGVDAVDGAMDSMSGTTSQPCLGSIVEALRHTERDSELDSTAIRRLSFYWEGVRAQYLPFESDLRSGASEVYLHEMPGGQFTNLREQARSLGLNSRWHEVAAAYRQANDLFGDIVKVTPSSKVVGDMALMMVSQGLEPQDVVDPDRDVSFPVSVVEMLRGELGQPLGGWPKALQDKVLKGETPITVRPGSLLKNIDLEAAKTQAQINAGRPITDQELASSLMYPKVFADFAAAENRYGPVSGLPTPVYFNGMHPGEEITVEIEKGKTLIVTLQAIGEPEPGGHVRLFFELNGQPRVIRVLNKSLATVSRRPKADEGNSGHIAAPMAGAVSAITVRKGQKVAAGDPLLTLEAMKMEMTLSAPRAGVVVEILVAPRDSVEPKDLLIRLD